MKHAFTLIELLVVITIIVVLLALLTPSLDKAIYMAEKVQCLSRQRMTVQACAIYAMDHKNHFPPNAIPGKGSATAYDIRMWWDENGAVTPYAVNPGEGDTSATPTPNLQLGLLPDAGYLPKDRLGEVLHCPTMDNTGNPGSAFGTGVGLNRGVGMDVVHDYGVGASWYNDPSKDGLRIIVGYHYRAASWELTGKGKLRLGGRMTSDTLITVDMPDQRFTGLNVQPGAYTVGVNAHDLRAFTHPDGYGIAFADGHAAFKDDPDYTIARAIQPAGGGYGIMAADTAGNAGYCETIYTQYMERNR